MGHFFAHGVTFFAHGPFFFLHTTVNVINNESDRSEMKDLIKEITDKSFTVIGTYVVFFIVFGLIWLPWILIEDLSGMADVAYIAYMPENDLTLFLFKFMMFALIMGYNLRALIIKTTKKIILITLFNLSVGYWIWFTMNADSISLIITWGFLAFYELREVSFIIITSWIYSIYPDVVKLECYSLYFISSVIYLLLYKMFMNDLVKLIKQESTSSTVRIQFQDRNQDWNLDNVGKPMIEHRKSVKIISDHHNGALRFISSKSTLIEVSLCICLLVCINIEIYLSLTLVHGVLMRGLMLFILAISHLILSENLSSSRSEAFGIDVKEKNS